VEAHCHGVVMQVRENKVARPSFGWQLKGVTQFSLSPNWQVWEVVVTVLLS